MLGLLVSCLCLHSMHGDENNFLIKNAQHDGFTAKKRLLCVIILNHDTLQRFWVCVITRYTKKAYFMLSQKCYVEYYVVYIHCNFPSNIKIAFIITCVKIYCDCVGGRGDKENSLSVEHPMNIISSI